MYRSVEVRWFVAGAIPTDVREWFSDGDLVRIETARTDDYLLLPDCTTVSLKIRAGRLEVKALTAQPEPVHYPNGVHGLRDAWVKWSSNAVEGATLRALAARAEDRWAGVTKHRLLRTFSLDSGDLQEVDGSRIRLTNGCQVELTDITARSDHPADSAAQDDGDLQTEQWWSLSLEAFGEPGSILRNLDRVATALFADKPPIELCRDASCSYPVWLARLAARHT